MNFLSNAGTGIRLAGSAAVFLLAQALVLQSAPAKEEIIAKARDYLGGGELLDSVRSIYYRGTFEAADGTEGEVEIIFKKPLQQRVKTVREDLVEVTVLNGYDAWRKVTDREDESKWTLVFLEADQIRELQANTWENLNFYKNIESRRGRIENHGLVELDGESCAKLTVHHPGGIYFDRYFDVETGKLLMTEVSSGGRIREVGSQRVSGIRFPESIIMLQDGEEINRVHFKEIAVNREFDEEMFEVPSMAPGPSGGPSVRIEEDTPDVPTPSGP